jgi:hypothetical protein
LMNLSVRFQNYGNVSASELSAVSAQLSAKPV